jgi:hypothetical protein
MIKRIILSSIVIILSFISSENVYAQGTTGSELGLEGYLGASTLGGNFGLGLKYGYRVNENIVIGPSVRIMKGWSTTNGANYTYSIYGGGGFAHARYGNMVFGGVELEILHSPFNLGTYSTATNWVPTLFLGGGFSREFKEIIRINAGVFYDVINSVNSPFRTSYKMTKTNSLTGQVSGFIPIIYRINFFIRIGKGKEIKTAEEEEEL